MFKFADDVDMVGAVDRYDLIPGEIQHVEAWAGRNNLVLNKSKTKEIIIRKPRMKQPPPSPTPGITRVSSLKILGVTFQDNLSMQQHVDGLIVEASNMLYAMNILRSHGMPQAQLYEVFRSKNLVKIPVCRSLLVGIRQPTGHRPNQWLPEKIEATKILP